MVQRVKLPDGVIAEFPDNLSDEQITQTIQNDLRSRRAEGGQPSGDAALPLSGGAEAGPTERVFSDDPDDPLRTVPTHIGGVEMTQEIREAILSGRSIENPRAQNLLAARIGGRIAALGSEGGTIDDIQRSDLGTAIRGFGAGIFGLGDVAAAAGTSVSSDLSFGEALEAQREFRRALEDKSPILAGAAEVGGALAGGGLFLRALRGVTAGTRAAPAVQKLTVFSKGGGKKGFVANTGRTALAGGAGQGITEAVTEADPLPGIGAGILAGPLGPALVKAANISRDAAKRFLADPASRGLRALAKQLGETPEEMATRFLRFQAVTGKKPSIADIGNPQAVAELNNMIAERTSAVAIAREAAETATGRRGAELAEEIPGGRVTTTQTTQKATRDSIARRQFAEANEDPINFDSDQVKNLLLDPDLRRALPATLRRRLDEAFEEAGEDAPVTLSGLDVNDLRLALRDRARGATGADRIFGDLADEVETIARDQSPAFARAIDEFASRSLRGEGVAAGRKAITQPTSEVAAIARTVDEANVAAGIRVGARSGLADVAREGSGPAATLSRRLSEDSGLVQRLRAVLPKKEVDRLQELGRVRARSAENIQQLAPGIRAAEDSAIREAVRDAVGAIVVAQGSTGGAFKAGIIARLVNRLTPKTSKRVAENIARDVFDPNKTEEIISVLRRAKFDEADILDLFASAFAAGSLAADN